MPEDIFPNAMDPRKLRDIERQLGSATTARDASEERAMQWIRRCADLEQKILKAKFTKVEEEHRG